MYKVPRWALTKVNCVIPTNHKDVAAQLRNYILNGMAPVREMRIMATGKVATPESWLNVLMHKGSGEEAPNGNAIR